MAGMCPFLVVVAAMALAGWLWLFGMKHLAVDYGLPLRNAYN